MKRSIVGIVGIFALVAALASIDDAQPLNPHGGGSGTITGVTAGTGLTGGGATGAVTVNVGAGSGIGVAADTVAIDPSYTQRRISTGCTSGNAVQTVNQDGSVACMAGPAADAVTGTVTSPDLIVATGAHTVGNYAGSTATACSAGQAVTQVVLSAAGVATTTCATAGITNAAGANVIPKSNGTNLVASTGVSSIGTSSSDTLTVNATTTYTAPVTVQDFRGTAQASTVVGTQNDFALSSTATILRWNGASNATFTGFAGGADGRVVIVENVTGNNLILSAESGSSTAANRLWLLGPSNQIVLSSAAGNPNSFATFVYDGTSSRWRMQSFSSQRVDAGMEWVQASQFDGTLLITGLSTLTGGFTSTAANNTVGNLTGTAVAATIATTTPQNNYAPAGWGNNVTILRINPTANATLTGLAAPTGPVPQIVILDVLGSGGGNTVLKHEDAGSTAANRFNTLDQSDMRMSSGGSAILVYDVASTRWHVAAANTDVFTHGLFVTNGGGGAVNFSVDASGNMSANGLSTLTGGFTSASAAGTVGQLNETAATPTPFTTERDDYTLCSAATVTVCRLSCSGACDFTGMTGGVSGRVMTLRNVGAQSIFFYNENTNSTTPADRFTMASVNATLLVPGGEHTVRYDGTTSRWIWDGQASGAFWQGNLNVNAGSLDVTSSGTIHGNLTVSGDTTLGDAFGDAITFLNGPSGINNYAGKHLEWTEEWAMPDTGASGSIIANPWSFQRNTAANATSVGGVSTRPGLMALDTSTATTGDYVSLLTSPSFVGFDQGNWTYEETLEWETLSSSTNSIASMYATLVGFFDTNTSVNQVDGCYFAYDKGNNLTGNKNAGNVDALECWCSNNSTRTGYLINASGNSDETFALGTGTIVAGTYYRLKIVVTGTTRAEFYRNGTKVCDINTNMPGGGLRSEGAGITLYPLATTGTGSRRVIVDQSRLAVDLTSARSP